jgi:hypothetical protein
VTTFTWLWIGWGALFAVIEGVALYWSHPGGTLSAHLWAWFGYDAQGRKSRKGWARVRRFMPIAFLLWVILHVVTSGWF